MCDCYIMTMVIVLIPILDFFNYIQKLHSEELIKYISYWAQEIEA